MRGNMKAERARIGLSADEVAKNIGVHVNSVLSWERGESEPRAENLVSLSHLYRCTPDYLMGYTNERNGMAIAKKQ